MQINRLANKILIVITNLDGFSLANHGRFAKFTKLSRYTVLQGSTGSPQTQTDRHTDRHRHTHSHTHVMKTECFV